MQTFDYGTLVLTFIGRTAAEDFDTWRYGDVDWVRREYSVADPEGQLDTLDADGLRHLATILDPNGWCAQDLIRQADGSWHLVVMDF